MDITQADVKEWFTYSKGKLFWKKRPAAKSSVYTGDRAGSITSKGYWQIKFKGKVRKEHKLIYLLKKGIYPDLLDHKNHDTLDNKITNLRIATLSQSQHNQRKNKLNTTGYKGVSWYADGRHGRNYKATVKLNNKRYHCGYFTDPKEAHKAYCKKAKELHGEFFHP